MSEEEEDLETNNRLHAWAGKLKGRGRRGPAHDLTVSGR